MMAYEIFAGQHPVVSPNFATVLLDILKFESKPDQLNIPPALTSVLETALHRNPAQRYVTANDMIVALAEAVERQDLLVETEAVRDSFLQSAKFVGRDTEFQQLTKALAEAKQRRGSAWLVGGESGVGKSRLLDELRTPALVDGALVLPGQAISEGVAPYQAWGEVLRRLCLKVEISAEETGLLKAVVFDIDRLLGCELSPPPSLDPQSTHQQLLNTITLLFQRYNRPAVVILEDIHWATSEGLALLQHLSRQTYRLPLLIVASYRNEEMPDLPARLPAHHHLRLDRLSEEGIAVLSESMLGSAGGQPAVLDLLRTQTEGNKFFIVEVMRTLAEEAGRLDKIGQATLPETAIAGGMQQVLRRRLNGSYVRPGKSVGAEAWLRLLVSLDYDPTGQLTN